MPDCADRARSRGSVSGERTSGRLSLEGASAQPPSHRLTSSASASLSASKRRMAKRPALEKSRVGHDSGTTRHGAAVPQGAGKRGLAYQSPAGAARHRSQPLSTSNLLSSFLCLSPKELSADADTISGGSLRLSFIIPTSQMPSSGSRCTSLLCTESRQRRDSRAGEPGQAGPGSAPIKKRAATHALRQSRKRCVAAISPQKAPSGLHRWRPSNCCFLEARPLLTSESGGAATGG